MGSSWVSWRQGRNYLRWHIRSGELSTKCGILIPATAHRCFAAQEFVAQLDASEVCTNCRKLKLAERIP